YRGQARTVLTKCFGLSFCPSRDQMLDLPSGVPPQIDLPSYRWRSIWTGSDGRAPISPPAPECRSILRRSMPLEPPGRRAIDGLYLTPPPLQAANRGGGQENRSCRKAALQP